MNSIKTFWKPFVGLAFCLVYPSIAIFKKVGYWPIVLYLFIAFCLMLSILWVLSRMKKYLTSKTCLLGLLVMFVSMLVAYVVIHPHIDTDGFRLAGINFGSSDADDAIDVAISECMEGRYPYYAKTFLGNPITPMPGALLLALPFYYFGDSAIQNIFWLAIFFTIIGVYHRSVLIPSILALFVFCISPNVIYQVFQGGDYISNAIYVLTFCVLLLESVRLRRPFWHSMLWALLLGIGLSSRMNFGIIIPLVFFNLMKASSVKEAFILLAITFVSFCSITVPFFLYDPTGFSPLHTANKLSMNGGYRYAPLVLPVIAGILSVVLAMRCKIYLLSVFMRDVAVVQIVLMVGGLILASLSAGTLNLNYPHFGILFLFFGVFAFGPATLIESGVLKNKLHATLVVE